MVSWADKPDTPTEVSKVANNAEVTSNFMADLFVKEMGFPVLPLVWMKI